MMTFTDTEQTGSSANPLNVAATLLRPITCVFQSTVGSRIVNTVWNLDRVEVLNDVLSRALYSVCPPPQQISGKSNQRLHGRLLYMEKALPRRLHCDQDQSAISGTPGQHQPRHAAMTNVKLYN